GQHPRSYRSPLECFDLRENSAAASRDLMQPGIRGIAGTSCDDGVVVPEHLITAGVELVPHQAPFAKVDVDRDQAEQSLEGPFRLAVSADRLAGLRKKSKRSCPPLGRIRQRGDILRMISAEDSGPAAMGPCGSRPRY